MKNNFNIHDYADPSYPHPEMCKHARGETCGYCLDMVESWLYDRRKEKARLDALPEPIVPQANEYNPPWKGDLTRGFWDCGHWYDFPAKNIKTDTRLRSHREMGGAPIFMPELWERIKEQEITSSLFPSYEGTTASPDDTKPLTLDDVKGMHDKLLAAGLLTHVKLIAAPPHLDVAFFNNTGMRLYWNKTVPRHGVTLILRTIGGVPVIGQWTGEYGQYFDAWAELPTDEPTTLKDSK